MFNAKFAIVNVYKYSIKYLRRDLMEPFHRVAYMQLFVILQNALVTACGLLSHKSAVYSPLIQ